MNLKKILAASAISLSMVAGVGAAIGVSAGANLKEAEVKAESPGYVYFKLTNGSNWLLYTNRFSAYFFSKTGDVTSAEAWADAPRANDWDNLVYKVAIPEEGEHAWTNVIFCRMNGGTSANNFDNSNRWSQTGDIAFSVTTHKGKVCNITTGNDGTDDFGNSFSWGSDYHEQSANLIGNTIGSVPLTIADENRYPRQYKLENYSVPANESFYISIEREGDATEYYGYDNLESGAGSLLTEGAVTKGAVIPETSVYKVGMNNSGSYSFYLKNDGKLWTQVDSDSIASGYADYFLANFTCSGGDAATVTAEDGVWTTLSTKWEGLVNGAKTLFLEAEPNAGGTKYQQVMARYKFVIEKYGTGVYADFMAKGYTKKIATIASPSILENNNTNFALIASIAAGTVITAVGATFLLRRRKEDR